MSTLFPAATLIRCSTSPLKSARAADKPSRCLPQRLRSTARHSVETPAIHVDGQCIGAQPTHDILKDVSESSRLQLAGCPANAGIGDADLRSLLLRIAAFHYLWCRFHAEADPTLCNINNMISKIAVMTHLLAGGNSQHVLQTIERHPPVIAQPTSLLFERMVRIKQLIPQADVSLVVAKRPSLLCMETEVLARKLAKAAQQLRVLMPAIPWETRLIQDSNLWMTFVTLLDDSTFGDGSIGPSLC